MMSSGLADGWSLSIAPYVIVLVGASLFCAALAGWSFRQRWSQGGPQFGVLMCVTSIWALSYALELITPSLGAKVIWAKVEFLGIGPLPLVWFLFARAYTGAGRLRNRATLFALASVPAATVVLAATNGLHNLMWKGVFLRGSVDLSVLALERGPWLWLFVAYSYAFLGLGGLLVARGVYRCPRFHRVRAALVLVAALAPLVANAVSVSGFIRATPIDLTPVALAMTGLVFALSMSRSRVLRVLPWLLTLAHRQILRDMTDAVLVLDADGRVASVNPAAGSMLALPPAGLMGKPASEFFGPRLDPCSCGASDAPPRFEFTQGEGDQRRFYDVVVSMVGLGEGLGMGHLVVARDVTERHKADRALEQREEELRQAQKMETVGQMAGGIAHDFNNLLTVVLGNCHMALANMSSTDPNRELLEEVLGAGERGAALCHQILAFSRRQTREPEVVCLNQIIQEMEHLLKRTLGRNIDLLSELAPDLRRVKADPHQIEQVLLNLVINSRDAMPDGGRLTIQTADATADRLAGVQGSSAPAGDQVVLAVVDTGLGMDEETKCHVFEPFFTTKEVGKGTGLGLSTVQRIVLQSGGSISVSSEPGRGTRFEVLLPATTVGVGDRFAVLSDGN
jgi:PAS domain S-box-containing protein